MGRGPGLLALKGSPKSVFSAKGHGKIWVQTFQNKGPPPGLAVAPPRGFTFGLALGPMRNCVASMDLKLSRRDSISLSLAKRESHTCAALASSPAPTPVTFGTYLMWLQSFT